MNPAGSLDISARYFDGRLVDIVVRLERPPVTRLFIGRAPEEVVATVPRLYTLCARAQGAAAFGAVAAARGVAPPAAADDELWSEALHEHLWRLLLDWPLALGLAPAKEAFVAWRAARGRPDFIKVTREIFASTLEGEWGSQCLGRLAEVGGKAESAALAPQPWLAYWRGQLAEVPETRRPGSVTAAWQSRRAEALSAGKALEEGLPYPVAATGADGWGVGQAMTARGVLTHAVRLEGEKVAAYRVWAPTDCHFADARGLAALLEGQEWRDFGAAERGLGQAVLALDPCLPYTIKVNHA